MLKTFKARRIKDSKEVFFLCNEHIETKNAIVPIENNGFIEFVRDVEEFDDFNKIASDNLYVTKKAKTKDMSKSLGRTIDALTCRIVKGEVENIEQLRTDIKELTGLKEYLDSLIHIAEIFGLIGELNE